MRPLAADIVVIRDGRVLLIKRATEPYKGMLALPGGRLEDGETLEQCAVREAEEETGLKVRPTSLVGIYSDPKRDPRGTVAAAYLCDAVGGVERPGFDTTDVLWYPYDNIMDGVLAFDHKRILLDALALYARREK